MKTFNRDHNESTESRIRQLETFCRWQMRINASLLITSILYLIARLLKV